MERSGRFNFGWESACNFTVSLVGTPCDSQWCEDGWSGAFTTVVITFHLTWTPYTFPTSKAATCASTRARTFVKFDKCSLEVTQSPNAVPTGAFTSRRVPL